MVLVLIDAVVLIFLLKIINDDDIGFGTAFVVALVASIGTSLLAFGLTSAMGVLGIFVAAAIGALILGFAIAMLFGVELKRSALIGVIFIVVHLGAATGLHLMMS